MRAPEVEAIAIATPALVILDTDGDGIFDDEDQCPLEAETENGYEDEDGCPDFIPDGPPPEPGYFRGVRFQANDHTLDQAAVNYLQRVVVRTLRDYPGVRVEISGHTDNRGSHAANQAISLKRAEVVRDYLIEQGIDPTRLTVVGYGGVFPIASNDHKEGRAANRRVEFEIIKEPP